MNRMLGRSVGIALLPLLVISGCATKQLESEGTTGEATQAVIENRPADNTPPQAAPAQPARQTFDPLVSKKTGTGRFVAGTAAQSGWNTPSEGDITLNFANADLREVVEVVLGEILGRNYTIDPAVNGRVTLRTTTALEKGALMAVLESVLNMNGVALVEYRGVYKVLPLAKAMQDSAPLIIGGDAAGKVSGFAIHVVPLRYVDAKEMSKILEPLVAKGGVVRVEERRNVLIIAAPGNNLAQLLETVRAFDVDYLAGMSFAILRLQYAEAKTLINELNKIFAQKGDGGGVISFEPIERLNAVLVLSKRPEYMNEAQRLIERLDQGSDSPSRSLHVYSLKHGKAEPIAAVLKELFSDQQPTLSPAAASAAPAAEPITAGTVPEGTAPVVVAPAAPAPVAMELRQPATIIADKDNNAILILANIADYRAVEAAIRKLDKPPRQVHIEATIAEVTLTDDLQHGIQWFLRGGIGGYKSQGLLSNLSPAVNPLPTSVVPGFSYSVLDAGGIVRFLFDLVASKSNLKILSSPQLMVIDNQTANIRVGDQIPVITRQTSTTTDPDAPLINEVQFRDTGVLLEVTPRINEGGMVTLEISQEVSEASTTEFAAGNVSILQRTIRSTIAVRDGQTALLGGLIRENSTDSVNGVPGLMDVPLVGNLFSRKVDNTTRTELVVTITPHIIENEEDTRVVVNELGKRLQNVEVLLKEARLSR